MSSASLLSPLAQNSITFTDLKIDIDEPTRSERLNESVSNDKLEVLQQLVEEGVPLNDVVDPFGVSILHLAASHGSTRVLEYLLSNNFTTLPSINVQDASGWTPLMCAANVCHIPTCLILLAKGADVTIQTSDKATVLHYACRKIYRSETSTEKVYTRFLKMLLERGLLVDHRNIKGETALMYAALKGNEDAVRFLLLNKANPHLVNSKGFDAIGLAEQSGHTNVVTIIKELTDNKTDLMEHDVKLDEMERVFELMLSKAAGIPLSHKKSYFVVKKNCFSGIDLIDWLLKHLTIRSREEAIEYGQFFLDRGMIVCINNKQKLKDSKKHLYRFKLEINDNPITASPSLADDQITIDDFETIYELGEGAFGRVSLVRRKYTDKLYAIKMINRLSIEEDSWLVKKLATEKKIMQNDCPFLIRLHHFFETETQFCMVMDYIGGGDLFFQLQQVKYFEEKIIQFFAAEMILALNYLHNHGVIYRDLKPANVLVDMEGHICLTDFGLSKESDPSAFLHHTMCGTILYEAPEILRGDAYNKAVDWYSLGLCMYVLLTGKAPYKYSENMTDIIRDILEGTITYPSSLSKNCVSLLSQLLEKDPRKRLDDEEVMKRHPFFVGIDWQKLALKKVPSPFKVTSYPLREYCGIDISQVGVMPLYNL